MSNTLNEINAAAVVLERAKKVVTVSHRRPDGDTLGSALALAEALESRGKTVSRFCVDAVPLSLQCLPGSEKITSDVAVFNGADTVVVLDSSDLRFVAVAPVIAGLSPKPTLLNIDHHSANERFGDLNTVVETASTTELVCMILRTLNWTITPNIATNLLGGIVTDTMLFFNPATTAASLQTASELQKLGGDLKTVSRIISKNKTVDALVLWGRALERLKFDEQRSHVSTVIRAGEMNAISPTDDTVDGLANFLNNNLSAKTVLVLRELADGMVKGSLRTADEGIDVSVEALRYGGGGHRKAAGFATKGRVVERENEWTIEV